MAVRGSYPVEVFIANKKPLQRGDVLLNRISGNPRMVGKPVAVYKGQDLGRNLSNMFAVRRTRAGQHIKPETLYHMLRYEQRSGTYRRDVHGTCQQFMRLSAARKLITGR